MTRAHWSAHLAKSGHLAVMAEYAARGYNVAMPEIDQGDDIFVVHDATGDFFRVQVKTARASGKRRLSARFTVGEIQLVTPRTPDLKYVFVVRHEDRWLAFFLIERGELHELQVKSKIGVRSRTRHGVQVKFNVRFDDRSATCGSVAFDPYRGLWPRDLTA